MDVELHFVGTKEFNKQKDFLLPHSNANCKKKKKKKENKKCIYTYLLRGPGGIWLCREYHL